MLMTLYPAGEPESPLALNSELVFLGRSSACGVSVDEPLSARVQCVIVRTETSAYAVNLLGRDTSINGRPLRYAEPIENGDVLAVGGSRFDCRILSPDATAILPIAAHLPRPEPNLALPTPPPGLFEGANQGEVLAWMMGTLQASQNELSRRQETFQREIVQAIRQLQTDNREAIETHLKSVQKLDDGLSALRDEVRRRFGPTVAPPRPSVPKVPPLKIAPGPGPSEADRNAATAWLIHRVNEIEEESKSSWKALLGRLGRGGKS